MTTTTLPLTIKWGKETVVLPQFAPDAGVKRLKQELEEKTGVPADRMKLMAKSKGLWKGLLKEDFDLTSIDWKTAQQRAAGNTVTCLLMGSAAKLVAPAQKTVFLEDLPPEEIAKVAEPAGLINLGNTCYLNSVVQCLRAVPALRRSLNAYHPTVASNNAASPNAAANAILMASLRDTLQRLDRQAAAVQPAALVHATKQVFPQFAQRGPQGQPMQQDAEEFFSGVLTAAAAELKDTTPALLNNNGAAAGANDDDDAAAAAAAQDSLQGAENLIDAVFGMKMKETLTCDELTTTSTTETADADAAAAPTEPAVVSYDLHRKLVCNIQGGSEAAAQTNVSHIAQGIQLALQGKIEKHSDVLGRNAVWTRTQRLARLPPVLTVQFGRFYWKATPDSADHAGVKCKIMKPVAFNDVLDVFEFCTPEIQKVLKVSRDKALAEEEDRINQKLKGQLQGGASAGAGDAMETDEAAKPPAAATTDDNAKKEGDDDDAKDSEMKQETADEEHDDDELKAALAMSMEEDLPPVGPGLPDQFQGLYELFAVVTHKGRDADGGHYMAWLKSDALRQDSGSAASKKQVEKIADTDVENADWFVFDDDEVSPCKTEDVLKLKGGGDWHMSYLNFYRAKK